MTEYKFTIPGELPTRNEEINASKKHWGAEGKLKREALKRCGWSDIKQIPELEAVKLEATFYREDRRTDPDNIISAIKYVIDSLQEYGVLENDGWNEVKGPMVLDWEKDKENPRTEIVVREVENES